MDRLVRLYTIQKPGHAITLRQNVSEEEINHGRLFHSLIYRLNRYAGSDPWYQVAQYLDWTSCISCLENVQDYDSPWFALENLIQGDLWTLLVPQEKIRWCSLDAQGENLLSVQEWFYPDPENIRNEGETPQALVEAPIDPAYLEKVEPAKDVFRKAGLWSVIVEDLFGNDDEF